MQDLALKVRGIDAVVVDDADPADAGSGQIQRRRRPEAARADQEDARLQQPLLAVDPDLGDE
jgi:hypothetical protein